MTSAWLSGYARHHKTRRITNGPQSSARCAQLAHTTALMVMSDQISAQVFLRDDLLINSSLLFFSTSRGVQDMERCCAPKEKWKASKFWSERLNSPSLLRVREHGLLKRQRQNRGPFHCGSRWKKIKRSQPTKAVTKDGGRCVFSLQAEFFVAHLVLHSFQKYSLLNILPLKKPQNSKTTAAVGIRYRLTAGWIRCTLKKTSANV